MSTKVVPKPAELKLFGRWGLEGIEVIDVGLRNYVSLKQVMVPHSGGRHEHRRFAKSEVNIVERLANNMMRYGRCGGKKAKAISIVKNAFEIVHLKTGKNPVEILVRAIENSAPCEDTTRVAYGGIVYHVAVDISPQRRCDLALRFLAEGARKASFGNPKSVEECLADELISASGGDSRSLSIQKKNEMERIAMASR